MSNWIDYKALRAQVSFSDVLKHYRVEAKVKGDRATALCPLPGHPPHRGEGKRTPSLSIHLQRGIFQCFGCKASGNVIDFCARMEGLDPADPKQFREAAIKVAQVFGSPAGQKRLSNVERGSSKKAAAQVTPRSTASTVDRLPSTIEVVVNTPLDFELKHLDPRHPYLSDRGMSPETIEHFGLGFCGKGLMKDRIAIPLHDAEGCLIGYAGRLTNDEAIDEEHPKYLFPGSRERDGKGQRPMRYEFHKSEFLFNGHRIDGPVSDLIVVEGFFSVFWLYQSGYPNAVSLMGSSVGQTQCRLLCDLLEPDGRLWILADADDAGDACATQLLTRLAPARFVRWAKLTDGQPTDLVADELATLLWAV